MLSTKRKIYHYQAQYRYLHWNPGHYSFVACIRAWM